MVQTLRGGGRVVPWGHLPETPDPQLHIHGFYVPCTGGGMQSGSEQHKAGDNLTSCQQGFISYTPGHPWDVIQSPDTPLSGQGSK